MKKIATSLTALSLALFTGLATAGCSTAASAATPSATALAGQPEAATSQAAKTEWPESIVLVQMPNENNPDAGTIHKRFSEALAQHLGIEVKEMEGTDYTVGVEAMASGNIDVMLVSPMSYFQAKQRAGAELLVSTPMASDYRTQFITRADNDEINGLEDLKGHSFAFVDQASSSGYMYPKAMLVKELGLDAELLENSDYFFSTVAFSGAHDASAMGVSMGDYEAAAVAGAVLQSMEQAGVVKAEDFKVIGETELIPNPAYVVRGSLPEDLKASIKEFFLSYDDAGYFADIHGDESIRFVDITEDDYQMIYDTLQILGIEGE